MVPATSKGVHEDYCHSAWSKPLSHVTHAVDSRYSTVISRGLRFFDISELRMESAIKLRTALDCFGFLEGK